MFSRGLCPFFMGFTGITEALRCIEGRAQQFLKLLIGGLDILEQFTQFVAVFAEDLGSVRMKLHGSLPESGFQSLRIKLSKGFRFNRGLLTVEKAQSGNDLGAHIVLISFV